MTPAAAVTTALRLRRARAAVVAYFALLGIANGDWLARVPALKHGLYLSDGMLGVALLASPLGLVAVAAVAGPLIDRVGSRGPIVAGGLAAALLPVAFGAAGGLTELVVAMFWYGVGTGLLDVAMNSQAVHLEREAGRPLMTSFHAGYSFGALAGGLLGGAFAWAGIGPVADFAAVGVPLAALCLAAVTCLLPDAPGDAAAAGGPAAAGEPGAAAAAITAQDRMAQDRMAQDRMVGQATSRRRPGRVPPLLVLGLLALCSLLGEGAADGWSAVYLRDQLGTPAGTAALGYAAFALTMALGRLSGDALAQRFGPAALLRSGGLLAAAGMAGALVSPVPAGAMAGFAAYGLGLSCTFPQLLSLAGHARPGRPAGAIARVAGAGYVGLLLGPVLIGGLASATGLATALSAPALLALAIAAGAGLAAPGFRRP